MGHIPGISSAPGLSLARYVFVCTGQRGSFRPALPYSTLFLAQCSLRPGQLLCTPAIPGLALPGTVPRWPPHWFLLSPFHPRALSMRLRDDSASVTQHCSAAGLLPPALSLLTPQCSAAGAGSCRLAPIPPNTAPSLLPAPPCVHTPRQACPSRVLS